MAELIRAILMQEQEHPDRPRDHGARRSAAGHDVMNARAVAMLDEGATREVPRDPPPDPASGSAIRSAISRWPSICSRVLAQEAAPQTVRGGDSTGTP